MDWAIYGALIAGFAATVAAVAHVVVQALKGWRSFKRLRRHTGKELARLAEAADAASASAARASDWSRLDASQARLRVALAEFAVLRSAFDEAAGAAWRLISVYPRK